MNNWTKYAAPVLVSLMMIGSISAQDQKYKVTGITNDKQQEIVIRKNRGNAEKMTIVVDGDNVTINGKPVDEFKNKDITVLKRDRTIAANPRARSLYAPGAAFDGENFDRMFRASNKAMLGIGTSKTSEGVKVTEVSKESGAEKAGLKKDDIITKVGDKEVKEPGELIEAIASYKPGDKVDLTYKRDGKVSKTSATLSENKARAFSYNINPDFKFEMPEMVVPPMNNFNFNFNRRPRIGMQIQDVEEGKGVAVKDVDEDSPASKAGFKDGDVITQVNGKDIDGIDELREAIKDLKDGETLKLSYKRDGKNQTAEIKIPKKLRTANL